MTLTFTVDGEAQPQGSIKMLPTRRFPFTVRNFNDLLRCVNLTSDNPALHSWRGRVSFAATLERRRFERELRQRAMTTLGDAGPMFSFGPVFVAVSFRSTAPASLSKRECLERAGFACVRPDVDKLARGILDALTGVVWLDDGQVSALFALKTYALTAGVHVIVANRLPELLEALDDELLAVRPARIDRDVALQVLANRNG